MTRTDLQDRMLNLLRPISVLTAMLGGATAFAQPANDNPCGAVALPVNTSCVNTAGTRASATNSAVGAPSCGSGSNDVWYTVVVPASGSLDLQTTAGTMTNAAMAVYTAASCAGPFTEIGCDDNSGPGNMPQLVVTCLTPGITLYVRIWRAGGTGSTFNICAVDPQLFPATNDGPCTATSLTLGTSCTLTAATNICATNTAGPPAPWCGNYTDGDVWFTFTAPASGMVAIETTAGTLDDAAMGLYAATACGGTFTQLACDDDSGPGLMPFIRYTALTPGQTYYLRVWGFGGLRGTFNLCAWAPAMPAGDCVYVLELFDSALNGWGSSSVDISINGGAFTSYSVTAGYSAVLIGLTLNDILVVQYTNSGPNQSQNSYFIRQVPGDDGVFLSGTPPTAGIVYTETADCVPPAKPTEDCQGGTTICNGQNFNNNTTHTGFDTDLNSANRGCLSSNERQGTWYHFTPSAGGTIGMTIAPNNPADDYDFAVWGPGAAVTCPPATAPYRCSYSSLAGNTGLGNGAIDVSEGSLGNKWVSTMNVTAGEVYTLYVSNWSQSGLAFTLSWQLTNGASLDCTVLPVELLTFEADAVDEGIDLRWSTATEMDNDHFVIERSADGDLFLPFGWMPGAGTTTQQTDYFTRDTDPLPGLNYYRLVQVDMDGGSETSQVVSAMHRPAGSDPVIYPNPSTTDVSVAFDMPGTGTATVRAIDARGRVALERAFMLDQGSAQVVLPTSWLDAGLYHLDIRRDGEPLGPGIRFIKR